MLESKFQSNLIKELEAILPGCIILKNDANYIQGFPDLLVLYEDTWAALECKRSMNSNRQPNQEYYIDMLSEMAFASFICPENQQEVIDELQQSFLSRRPTRLPKRK